MENVNDVMIELSKPFPPEEIDWKIQRSGTNNDGKPWGQVVAYVDARAIMRRLDVVVGPENWQTKLIPTANGMLCELSIRVGGEWVSKMDGSDETDYEPFKGGISKALVRAAVHWGIGRELYDLEMNYAEFVPPNTKGARWTKIDGKEFFWIPKGQNLATAPAVPQENRQAIQQTAVSAGDDLDNEIITFGKHNGKRMIDVGAAELRSYYDYIKKKDPGKPDSRGMARIAAYIASRTTRSA